MSFAMTVILVFLIIVLLFFIVAILSALILSGRISRQEEAESRRHEKI